MLIRKICGYVSDLFQDSMAKLLAKSMYTRPSKAQKSSSLVRRALDLANTTTAHVVAVGVLVKMEPKMARDADNLLHKKNDTQKSAEQNATGTHY